MGSPSPNVQYHPPRLSEDRLNLPQPHSPSLPTHCSGKSGMRPSAPQSTSTGRSRLCPDPAMCTGGVVRGCAVGPMNPGLLRGGGCDPGCDQAVIGGTSLITARCGTFGSDSRLSCRPAPRARSRRNRRHGRSSHRFRSVGVCGCRGVCGSQKRQLTHSTCWGTVVFMCIAKKALSACVLLLAVLQTTPQPASASGQLGQQGADIGGGSPEQQIVATESAPIRISPPTPWLLGLPGWTVAHTEAKERYRLLRTFEIQVFSSTYAWAEVELTGPPDPTKSGWVYWGESFTNDGEDFQYASPAVQTGSQPTEEGPR